MGAAAPASFETLFSPLTEVGRLTKAVGASTDIARLRVLGQVSQSDEKVLENLPPQIAALASASPEAELRVAEEQAAAMHGASLALEAATSFDPIAYNDKVAAYESAVRDQEAAGYAAFAGAGIPGAMGSEWRVLLDAAHSYEQAMSREHEHEPDGLCPYCRQPLGQAALELVHKYREFSRGEARQRRVAAERALGEALVPLDRVPIDDALADLRKYQGSGAKWEVIVEALERACTIREVVRARQRVVASRPAHTDRDALARARSERERINGTVTSLRSAQTDRTAALAKHEVDLRLLKDRVTLRSAIPAIEEVVERARRSSTVTTAMKALTTSLRSLTEASTEHATILMNTEFERYFNEECTELEAPDEVQLEFPGREAEGKRKKVIQGDIRPSDVLSEGEQKAVALADFIAEARISATSGPLVFDDPVNSLDYRRLDVVAQRLQRLAGERQVIVFTHNVWFASVLLDVKAALKKNTRYWDVSRGSSEAGIVNPGTHPKIDSYSNLRSRLNVVMEAARRQQGDELLESVSKGYSLLRSMTEIVAEQDLFKGVSQRYQAHVMVDRLPDIDVSTLQDSIDRLHPIYTRACRVMDGHSQPIEQSNLQSPPDRLAADFKAVDEIHKLASVPS
jgi:hypothetical protein